MVIKGLRMVDDTKSFDCCSYTDRRSDLDTFVPQLIHYNQYYQSLLALYWPSYSTCQSAEKEYVIHGTCMPEKFREPYKYFDASVFLFEKYNIWTVLSQFNIQTGKDYVYSKSKFNQLLESRGFPATVNWNCESKDEPQMLTSVDVCFSYVNNEFTQVACPLKSSSQCGNYLYFSDMPELSSGKGCPY